MAAALTACWMGARGVRAASDVVMVRLPDGSLRQALGKILKETWQEGVTIQVEADDSVVTVPLENLVKVSRGDKTPDYSLGLQEFENRAYEKALDHFLAAYKGAPPDRPWLKPYSLFDAAESAFREAKYARVKPEEKQTFYDRAEKLYARLLKDHPEHRFAPDATLGRGIALMRLDRFAEAREVLAAIGAIAYPARLKAAAQVWSGRLLVEEGNYEAALTALGQTRQAVQENYPDLGYVAMLSEAYAHQGEGMTTDPPDEGKLRMAENLFREVGLRSGVPELQAEAFNGRGLSLLARGDQREALFSFLRVVVLHRSVSHEYERALCYAANTAYEYYKEDPKKAKELAFMLSPNSPWREMLAAPLRQP